VITTDVPPDLLALGRSRQMIKDGWAARLQPHRRWLENAIKCSHRKPTKVL
jgi:hypothetical protein